MLLLLLLLLFVSEGRILAPQQAMGRTWYLTFTMGRLLYQLGWWIGGAIIYASIKYSIHFEILHAISE
jgi:hypothetical protein